MRGRASPALHSLPKPALGKNEREVPVASVSSALPSAHINGAHPGPTGGPQMRRCRAPQTITTGSPRMQRANIPGFGPTTPPSPTPKACAPAPVLRAPRPVTGALRLLACPAAPPGGRGGIIYHTPRAACKPAVIDEKARNITSHLTSSQGRRTGTICQLLDWPMTPPARRWQPVCTLGVLDGPDFSRAPLLQFSFHSQTLASNHSRRQHLIVTHPTPQKPTRVRLVPAPPPLGVRPRKRLRAG